MGTRQEQYRVLKLGQLIERAAAVIPASGAQTPYFTVSGGWVEITSFVGAVTVIFDATATTIKFIANPTVGADNDICGASASLANMPVGGLLSIDGTAITTALQSTSGGNVGGMKKRIIVAPGTIDILVTNTNALAACRWALTYVPYDASAAFVALA